MAIEDEKSMEGVPEGEEGDEEGGRETGEEGTELEAEGGEAEEAEGAGNFFSPEGTIMLSLAVLMDLAGLFLLFLTAVFGIGQFLSPILDVFALIFIGGWMLFRSGQIASTKGAKKVLGKILKRLGLSFLVESIPLLGDTAPSWTIAVIRTLKNK